LLEAQFDGIDAELFGDFIELNFLSKARLRRTVAALWPAGRLIGENPHAFKFISRHFVGDRLQCAGVVDRRQAITAVAAAVEIGFILHRLNRTVVLYAGLR
jgi:hypothetical protein